jgi:hydroxymethylpyrimidine pyrophosphatase-like HAD family hydrolase
MLEVAGRAVLMGNAPESLKATAAERGWVVGKRHDEDGVAEVIEAVLGGTWVSAPALAGGYR